MFQTRRLLEDKWSDATGLTRFLRAYGYQVNRLMVHQWFVRACVPAKWAFLILALLEVETGQPVSLAAYRG